MFALFDYSSVLGLSTDQLIMHTIVGLFLASCCAYILYYQDHEAKRLLDLSKQWGKKVEDDAKELKKTKLWLAVGYSVFPVLSLLGTARVCLELMCRF
jgi:hypothetical protein